MPRSIAWSSGQAACASGVGDQRDYAMCDAAPAATGVAVSCRSSASRHSASSSPEPRSVGAAVPSWRASPAVRAIGARGWTWGVLAGCRWGGAGDGSPRAFSISGMTGIVGWNEWAFAGTHNQRVVETGPQLHGTRTAGSTRRAGCAGFVPTARCDRSRWGTVAPSTEQVGLIHIRAARCAAVGPRPEVGDVRHVDPVGDNEPEDRITEHVAGDRDRHRPTPAISHNSAPSTRPCCSACTSMRSNA